MSGWEVGDIALCIKQSEWREVHDRNRPQRSPQLGCRYVVTETVIGTGDKLFLGLQGFSRWEVFGASRFIKVTPDEDLIAEERKIEVPA